MSEFESKIDPYPLINSDAIREYLKSIDFKFDALHIAYLISFDYKLTIKEKQNLYKLLMDNYQDVQNVKYIYGKASLFELIKRHISIENKVMDEFLNEKDALYSQKYDVCVYYRTLNETKESLRNSRAHTSYDDDKVKACHNVYKYGEINKFVFNSHRYLRALFNKDLEMMRIENVAEWIRGDEKLLNLDDVLRYAVQFPTPFKKGDILYIPSGNRYYEPLKFIDFAEVEGDYSMRFKKVSHEQIWTYKVIDDDTVDYILVDYYKGKLGGVNKALVDNVE